MSRRLLSVEQLAERWGWKAHRIYRLVEAKQIPFVKLGGRIWFREESLDRWLAEREQRPETPAKKDPRQRTREEECAALGIPVNHRYA